LSRLHRFGILYESFIHPLRFFPLYFRRRWRDSCLLLCRTEFSIIALIGIILLIGIVKKNAL